jgi:DNA-binding response OmpR family regulator
VAEDGISVAALSAEKAWHGIYGKRLVFFMCCTVKKPLVLVLDDHRQVLKFIEINLKLHGFEVITTTSGEEALEAIRDGRPDILLLDIIMPGMDGFEVLRQMRVFSQLPVIAFSASIANYDEAIKLGANEFISKPFNVNDLAGKIKSILAV